MNLLYNTQNEITSKIEKFIKEYISCLHKPQEKIIPSVIFGMIMGETVVSQDIARELKGDFSLIQLDSVSRRIRRLLNNKRFNGVQFYKEVISYVVDNYKVKHSSNRVYLTIDHMYCKENYTVLFISMRIGKQGIPIYFECFKGIRDPEAFYDETIIKAIDNTYSFFKNKQLNIVFLADRWFNSKKVLEHINDLDRTYCFRLKGNLKISCFDKKEGHYIIKKTEDLISLKYHSTHYNDIYMYENLQFKTNIAVSKKCVSDQPWIIATNGDVKCAIRSYSYRFGSIETIFKNQKSNGFYLEDICTSSLTSFINLYSLVCFAILFLTIIGTNFTKNTNCYKNVKLTTHK